MQYLVQRKNLEAPEVASYFGEIATLPAFAEYWLSEAKIVTKRLSCQFSGSSSANLRDVSKSIVSVLAPAISDPKLGLLEVQMHLHVPIKLESSEHEDSEGYSVLNINGYPLHSLFELTISQFGLKKSWYDEHRRALPKGAFKKDTETMKRWYQQLDRELRKVIIPMSSGIIE